MDAGSQALPKGALIGKYEITQVLGIGGFGITYKARDRRLECNVAIKEYLPVEYAFRDRDTINVQPHSNSTANEYAYGLQRFLEEARTLAKFKDANIVRVVDHIEANGTAYLVMDYEEGETLSQRLKREGTLSENALLAVILPILNGLRTVHSVSILHRDIKPGNIYLRLNGSPVLIDFGSAKQDLGEQTRSITTMVTAGYAPLEQYSNRRKQGPYTDLYALGATMYRCINGNNALPQSTERIIATNDNAQDPLVSATTIGAGRYNRNLLEAVDWMLKIQPKDRPQTVDEVLETIASHRGSPEAADLTGFTGTEPDASLNADVDISTEPTIPILEIEAIDSPVNHRHRVSRRPRRKKAINISLGVVAISATAISVGIWQQWIEMEHEVFSFLKTTRTTESLQTVAAQTALPTVPPLRDTPDPTIANEQAGDTIVRPVNATTATSDTNIQVVDENRRPTMASADDTLHSPPLPEEAIVNAPLTATAVRVSTEPASEALPGNTNSVETAQTPPASEQDSSPEAVELAAAQLGTTGEAVVPPTAANTRPTAIVEQKPVAPAPLPEPIEDPTIVAERKRQQDIEDLLAKGANLFRTGKLTRPNNNNALVTYLKVIELDPDNARATQALNRVGARLQAIAEEKLNDLQFQAAERYIDLALTIHADNTAWLALKDLIGTERESYYSHQQRLDQLFQHAEESKAKGITLEAISENTADIYLEVLAMDSANQAARTGLIDTLVLNRQLIQSNPSLEGYQRLTHYALMALDQAPKDEAINSFYLDLQRESALWQEQQNTPKITRIVTANTEPTGNTPTRNHFSLAVPRIYVAFDYHNFASSAVIRAVLFDGAQKIKLMQVPVVTNSTQGTHIFYLNKPIDGFQTGSYRLEMILGDEHIAAAEFVIEE